MKCIPLEHANNNHLWTLLTMVYVDLFLFFPGVYNWALSIWKISTLNFQKP